MDLIYFQLHILPIDRYIVHILISYSLVINICLWGKVLVLFEATFDQLVALAVVGPIRAQQILQLREDARRGWVGYRVYATHHWAGAWEGLTDSGKTF